MCTGNHAIIVHDYRPHRDLPHLISLFSLLKCGMHEIFIGKLDHEPLGIDTFTNKMKKHEAHDVIIRIACALAMAHTKPTFVHSMRVMPSTTRTHTCGELTLKHVGETVSLCGWVHHVRDKGGLLWIDLRDRYGITQLIFEEGVTSPALLQRARMLGREYVIGVGGKLLPGVPVTHNFLPATSR